MKMIDLTGQRFGRLAVLERSLERPASRLRWLCQCDCGNMKIVSAKALRNRDTRSCGCLVRELASKRCSLVLDGQRFGRWMVIKRAFDKPSLESRWLCRCDCGNMKVVLGSSLSQGRSQSCGCFAVETTIKRNKKEIRVIDNSLYRLWSGIKARCLYPNATGYKRYGGRGITICERWQVFENFVSDMPSRPSPKHSIHRLNNCKGYEPGNVCWATPKEQALARQLTRIVLVDGIADSVSSTALRVGISDVTLACWMKRGFSPQQIVNHWRTRACHSMKGLLCLT